MTQQLNTSVWLSGPGFKNKDVQSRIVHNSEKFGNSSKSHQWKNELINHIILWWATALKANEGVWISWMNVKTTIVEQNESDTEEFILLGSNFIKCKNTQS